MADVASRAGVSHQTVSRVLNDHPYVRSDTRARVLAAAAELDFRRNTAARALVTGSSRQLGVVSMDTALYGPASTLLGIERAARDADYFVSNVSVRTLDRRSILDAIERLRGQAVDGIILIIPHVSAARAVRHVNGGLPLVVMEGGAASVPAVKVDQRSGAAAATRHLLELGHRTVWHIAGPPDWMSSHTRIDAWRETLEAAGASVPDVMVGDWSARSGYEAGQVLAGRSEVTAIFAANDHMALGVLRALRERDRDVPGDVSVIGFDDIPEAAYFAPLLTTVRQDFAEVGRRGLGLLVDQIEGRSARSEVYVPTELIVRMSTARAPRS